jgi:hypothetical protein
MPEEPHLVGEMESDATCCRLCRGFLRFNEGAAVNPLAERRKTKALQRDYFIHRFYPPAKKFRPI